MNLHPIIEKRLARGITRRADKLQLITHLNLPSDLIRIIKQFYFDTIKAKADSDRDVINYLFTFGRFSETIPCDEMWLAYRRIVISDIYGYAHESCQIDLGNETQGIFHYDLQFVTNPKVVKKYWRGAGIVKQKSHSWGSNFCTSCGNYIRPLFHPFDCNC